MKVLNRRTHAPNEKWIYVGRPSSWGNPYNAETERSREKAIEKFKVYAKKRLERQPNWLEPLKDAEALICWCYPKACHAEVLVEMVEENFERA